MSQKWTARWQQQWWVGKHVAVVPALRWNPGPHLGCTTKIMYYHTYEAFVDLQEHGVRVSLSASATNNNEPARALLTRPSLGEPRRALCAIGGYLC